MATTKNLAEVIRRQLASDHALAAAVEAERINIRVGREIHRGRSRNVRQTRVGPPKRSKE